MEWTNPMTVKGVHFALKNGEMADATGFYYLQSRYYDPAVGRFINADSYASTGQGIVGHNMFAYCLCNPVNFYDGKGTDAIWIQEGGSAGYMGHSGLLVQDSEGNWWYFYWGPTDPNADFIGMCFYTDEICIFVDLNANGSDIQNLEDVRAALQNCPNSSDARVGEQADDITGILYLEGDYTNTYRYLSTLSNPDTLNNPMVQYSLFFNNCSQQTVRALSASNGAFLTVDSLIPNYAYIRAIIIKNMQNFSLKYEIRVALL